MYRFVGWPLLTSRTESIAIGAQEHQSTCETNDVCAVLFVYQSVCCYSAIDEDEKAFLRRTLLENVEEPVQQVNFLLFPFNFLLLFFRGTLARSWDLFQVSAQLVALISRIARTDCPDKWPELLPFLAQVGEGEAHKPHTRMH